MVLFQRHHLTEHDRLKKQVPAEQKQQSSINRFIKTTHDKWQHNDPRQIESSRKLVSFVAGNLQALSVVECGYLHDFVESLNPSFVMPSRKHLSRKLLPDTTTQLHASVNAQLQLTKSVSLTIDIWSSRDMRSYIGITCHFVMDYKICSLMLSCNRFRGTHSAEHIRAKYAEIITAFELHGKVASIITDNASNMLKAFVSLPGMAPIAAIDGTEADVDYEDVDLDELEDTDSDPESELKLEQYTQVRWNSQLKMIRKVRLVKAETMQQLNYDGKLSPYEKPAPR